MILQKFDGDASKEWRKHEFECKYVIYILENWPIQYMSLPILDSFVLWGASMLMSNGKIILAGGSTPKHGKLKTIFEYNPVFGFKLLETTLASPR